MIDINLAATFNSLKTPPGASGLCRAGGLWAGARVACWAAVAFVAVLGWFQIGG